MRLAILAALVSLAGCDRLLGLDKLDDDGGTIGHDDARDDAGIDPDVFVPDAPPGCLGRFGPNGSGLFCTLLANPGGGTLQGTIDTDSDARCAQPAPTATEAGVQTTLCVIEANNLTIGDLTVMGSRPLVVASEDTLTVSGVVVVATVGNWGGCKKSIAIGFAGSTTAGGGGGGAGGSFGGRGGDGGTANAADGGHADVPHPPSTIHGGCVGGDGGAATNTGLADGGKGGGAIYLISRTGIQVTGKIFASGIGGNGGAASNSTSGGLAGGGGGGGGGSGGLIGLDAPVVVVASGAVVSATGGGGGGGGGTVNPGTAGSSTTPTTPIPTGGKGGDLAEAGGIGAFSSSLTGGSPGPAMYAGAGGGGGGGGAIVFFATSLSTDGAVISPPALVP